MIFPDVPVGLATKLGAAFTAFSILFALVAAVLKGDHSQETLGALFAAAVTAYGVIRGRSDQAAAGVALAPAAPKKLKR